MYRRGSESWRFGHGDEGYLTTALLVRDAAHLPVPAAADIPPPLTADVALGHGPVVPAEQEGVADDWVAWWRRLVGQAACEASRQWDDTPVSDEPFARIKHRVAGRDEVFDPPDFRSLAATPALQAAARAVLTASRGHPHDRDGAGDPVDRTVFKWETVRHVAEQTAAELRVSVGSMAGYAHVLEVDGEWWYLAGPGCALCSNRAARDPAISAVILREVFSTGRRPLST